MCKDSVNKMCKSKAKANLWAAALKDAETRLREAKQDVSEWQTVVNVCRARVAKDTPWPTQSLDHSKEEQHSV